MAKKKEPTLRDVLDGMNSRFNMVFTELQKNDTRFDLAFRQFRSIHDNIKEIRETQNADSEVLDEVRETVNATAKAVDTDAITIINHESRIKRLEKTIK